MKRIVLLALVSIVCAAAVFAAPAKIAIFIPGARAGSPIYDDMAKGVERFAAENPGSTVKVYEAGFNQAEWEEKLTSLVALGAYDYLVTSNPSMPDLIAKIAPDFPKLKFICLDGQLSGVPNAYTVLYNQLEQGYVTGYLAGLASVAPLPGAQVSKKVGMVIGQHYPTMDRLIVPGFEQGLKAADPGASVDVRVVGNWFDATKAADLSRSLIAQGISVILPICGSASQGVLKALQDAGRYAVFFDGNEFARAPKTIIGCTILQQERLAYTTLKAAADGTLPFGTAAVVGMKDGYTEFLDKHPTYVANVPAAIRAKVSAVVEQIKAGKLQFKVPTL
jgi:simple sugar transport system substrate-binding protein